MDKVENKMKKAKVGDLIVLCELLDSYSDFSTRLTEFLAGSKYAPTDIRKLFMLSRKERFLGYTRVKEFYEDNKETLSTIKNNTGLFEFILGNYNYDGSFRDDSDLNEFYQYILDNADNVDTIKAVLLKLKKIGITSLEFDEKIKFTDNFYKLDSRFNYNSSINFFDNIEIIPNYEKTMVEYTTKGSPYKLDLKFIIGGFSCYHLKAIVNTLVFNPDLLPDKLDKKTVFDSIVELKTQEKSCDIIRDSVDLSIGIDNLCSQFTTTSNIIERIDTAENKEEFTTILTEIKERLNTLQTLGNNFNEKVVEANEKISIEKIGKEKQLYLKRIRDASIDSC